MSPEFSNLEEKKLTVLVVDQDDDARKDLRTTLEKIGCQVVEAADKREALFRMHERIFIVLLEYNTQSIGGSDTLIEIKKKFPSSQIIIVPTSEDFEKVMDCIEQGAFWYIPKPIVPDALIALIKRAAKYVEVIAEYKSLTEPNDEEASYTKEFIGKTLKEIEEIVLIKTLSACGGNKAKAARVLGISEKSIYNKLARYGRS